MTGNTLSQAPLPSVTVQMINNVFRLTCPKLGITCTAPTIEAGYATLKELVAETSWATTSSHESADGAHRKATPSAPAAPIYVTQRNAPYPLLMPAIVVALVLPIVLMSLAILNDIRLASSTLQQLVGSTTSVTGNLPYLARSSSQTLAHLADLSEKLTPERQEELQRNLERISIKLAPAARGLKPLFEAIGLAQNPADQPSSTLEHPAPTSPSQDSEEK